MFLCKGAYEGRLKEEKSLSPELDRAGLIAALTPSSAAGCLCTVEVKQALRQTATYELLCCWWQLRQNKSTCEWPDPATNDASSSWPVHLRQHPPISSASVSFLTFLYFPLPLPLSCALIYCLCYIRHSWLSPCYPLFIAQQPKTAQLPNLFPHQIHYSCPSLFFIFIHQFNSSSHPSN